MHSNGPLPDLIVLEDKQYSCKQVQDIFLLQGQLYELLSSPWSFARRTDRTWSFVRCWRRTTCFFTFFGVLYCSGHPDGIGILCDARSGSQSAAKSSARPSSIRACFSVYAAIPILTRKLPFVRDFPTSRHHCAFHTRKRNDLRISIGRSTTSSSHLSALANDKAQSTRSAVLSR